MDVAINNQINAEIVFACGIGYWNELFIIDNTAETYHTLLIVCFRFTWWT